MMSSLGEYIVGLTQHGFNVNMYSPLGDRNMLYINVRKGVYTHTNRVLYSEFDRSILSADEIIHLHIEMMVNSIIKQLEKANT